MVKLKLEDEPAFEDATIWAISTDLPALRLAFLLNLQLRLKLVRDQEDHCLIKKTRAFYFCSFSQYAEHQMQHWHLTANQGSYFYPDPEQNEAQPSRVKLVPELGHFDYFLWCEDFCDSEQSQHIGLVLKELNHIRTFQKLSAGSSKNLKNLLIET